MSVPKNDGKKHYQMQWIYLDLDYHGVLFLRNGHCYTRMNGPSSNCVVESVYNVQYSYCTEQ